MIEQIRGHGGDDLHFRSGGARLDESEALPMYLIDFEPDELEPAARAAQQRILEGAATEEDEELDAGCACGYRHRPDFTGDCRNDYQSFTELEAEWRAYGIEPDYRCRGGHDWINRVTLQAALAADRLSQGTGPDRRRAAAREYLVARRGDGQRANGCGASNQG